MENPQIALFAPLLLYHTVAPALKLSTFGAAKYNGSRTSRASLGESLGRCFCVCVCAMIPVALGNRNEYIILKAAQVIAGAEDDIKHFLGMCFEKQPCRHGTHYKDSSGTTAAAPVQPEWYNSTFTLWPVTNTVILCWCMYCSPGDAIVTIFSPPLSEPITH